MYEPSAKAKTVCEDVELSEKALRLLEDDPPASAFLSKLKDDALYRDGIKVLALFLSERQLVWWGCLAVEHLTPPKSGTERDALGCAVRWVVNPNEQTRQEASSAGEPLTVRSSAGALALAAVWSDNAAHLAKRVVPSTILLAANKGGAGKRKEREADAFTLGLDVLTRQLAWS